MAKSRLDGVIEAVRFDEHGMVQLVRLYERRGPTWSDVVLVTREELIRRIRSGKKFVVGSRKPLLAGTFELREAISLQKEGAREYLSAGYNKAARDEPGSAPIF